MTLAEAQSLKPGEYRPLSVYAARKLAKEAGIRVPRVGYEVRLTKIANLWLCSTGHAQFGWFESKAKQPFEVRHY